MKMKREISRRDMLKNAGLAIGGLGVSNALTTAAQTSTGFSGPRTLALIGDRYHNADYIRTTLDRLFEELGLPINYTANYNELSAELLKPYHLFICFRDNMIWPEGYLGPGQWTDAGFLENPEDFRLRNRRTGLRKSKAKR